MVDGAAIRIRVAVVDDEALVRSGFEAILAVADDIDVVGTCDGAEALAMIDRVEPDVVLLDIRMPRRSGLDVLTELLARPDPPAVAILTTFDSDDHIAQALTAGASGFLVKDTDPEELPRHIRALAAGAVVLSPNVSRTVVRGYVATGRSAADAHKLARLTDRERHVLTHLTRGATNSEIGSALFLSVGTVKDHVSAILAKLDVTTRVQAAIVAERGGLDTEADVGSDIGPSTT